MKIIVDTNIIISALIADSLTRKIIMKSELEFYYPDIGLNEIIKYKHLILQKSQMKENELDILLSLLLKRIVLLSEDRIKQKFREATEIFKTIDPDDIIFLAAALSIKDSIIWSEDKDFERQKKVKVMKTKMESQKS